MRPVRLGFLITACLIKALSRHITIDVQKNIFRWIAKKVFRRSSRSEGETSLFQITKKGVKRMRGEGNPQQCETMFIAFCVRVLFIAQKKAFRDLRRYDGRELSLNAFPDDSLVRDSMEFITYPEVFAVWGQMVEIYDPDLAEAIHKLPKVQRDIILIYYLLGYRDGEIGEMMQMNRRTVQYQRTQALKRLRKIILECAE